MITKDNFFKFLQNYVKKQDKVLDIGCGDAKLVSMFHSKKIDVCGIDVEFKSSAELELMVSAQCVKKIPVKNREEQDRGNIVWPIEDDIIDFAYSRAVIEHVPDLEKFVQELYRVKKNNGVSIHYFPSSTQIVECHTGIPFGAVFQNLLWYRLMVSLKLCNKKYQRPNGAVLAYSYMQKYTFYRSTSDIRKIFEKQGFVVLDITDEFLRNTDTKLGILISNFRFLTFLFRVFRSKTLLIKWA